MQRAIRLLLVIALLCELPIPLFSQTAGTRIAIMDFQNTSGNNKLDYLQASIPEMLITSLAKEERLNIVERNRLQDAVKEMRLGMSGVVDQAKAAELGKAVGASAILVGSYLEIGGVIRVNARLIDVKTSKVLKAESVQGRAGKEIFSLMDQLAGSIKNQLIGRKKANQPQKIQPQRKIKQPVKDKPKITTRQPVSTGRKKGGSKAGLYLLGAAVIGGGVAAAILLGGGSKDDGGGGSSNSTVSVTVNLP